MVDQRLSGRAIMTRCIKCGCEFRIVEGKIKQKKIRKSTTITKKNTGMPTINASDEIRKEQQKILKQHREQERIRKEVARVNEINRQMRRKPLS